jgi:hypothetical protein
MTNRLEKNRLETVAARRLACWRCGTEFTCGLGGSCWCAEEAASLPLPVDGEDCLCRECLRRENLRQAATIDRPGGTTS